MMKESIASVEASELFMIVTNIGIVYFDYEGNWWLGCSRSRGGIGVFYSRDEAERIRDKIVKQDKRRNGLIGWTTVVKAVMVKK